MKSCMVDGCAEPPKTRGYCGPHAERVRRYGDPRSDVPIAKKGAPLAFLSSVERHEGDDCLLWPFTRNDNGYPQLWVGGRLEYAHREMCRRRHGNPPTPVHEAAHSCGKGHLGCINPRHLSWKTRTENAADMVGHGTRLRGEHNPSAKLTESDARRILGLKGVARNRDVAAEYGISSSHVSTIWSRRIWAWL